MQFDLNSHYYHCVAVLKFIFYNIQLSTTVLAVVVFPECKSGIFIQEASAPRGTQRIRARKAKLVLSHLFLFSSQSAPVEIMSGCIY